MNLRTGGLSGTASIPCELPTVNLSDLYCRDGKIFLYEHHKDSWKLSYGDSWTLCMSLSRVVLNGYSPTLRPTRGEIMS
jgi:hypothetical protein